MSRDLLKISQNIADTVDEAIELNKLAESSKPIKKEAYHLQLRNMLNDSRKLLIEYSQKLSEVSEEQKEKVEGINVRKREIKDFVRKQKEKEKKDKRYRIYKSNFYSKISNFFMEDLSFLIARKYPDWFKRLAEELSLADIKILSRTYLSIILLTTILAFPVLTAISFIFLLNIWVSLLIGIFGMLATFVIIYKYPSYQKRNRAQLMQNELVYAFFHMSAVASSGAPPIKIFKLLLDSKEYKNLQSEFERILNYINVFGYNLTTSLKAVAASSPSESFKDFLYGVSSNLESGGDIKEYLKIKSEDELVRSRLRQQKYLETISTFSEIYIGVLIAAPLLFIVTLAILERISPVLLGIPISRIAWIGVFILLPVLNVMFMLLFESSRKGR